MPWVSSGAVWVCGCVCVRVHAFFSLAACQWWRYEQTSAPIFEQHNADQASLCDRLDVTSKVYFYLDVLGTIYFVCFSIAPLKLWLLGHSARSRSAGILLKNHRTKFSPKKHTGWTYSKETLQLLPTDRLVHLRGSLRGNNRFYWRRFTTRRRLSHNNRTKSLTIRSLLSCMRLSSP